MASILWGRLKTNGGGRVQGFFTDASVPLFQVFQCSTPHRSINRLELTSKKIWRPHGSLAKRPVVVNASLCGRPFKRGDSSETRGCFGQLQPRVQRAHRPAADLRTGVLPVHGREKDVSLIGPPGVGKRQIASPWKGGGPRIWGVLEAHDAAREAG